VSSVAHAARPRAALRALNIPPSPSPAGDECLANKCGWCINTRRCAEDIPWQCAGEVDHIGALTGKTCPSRADLAAARAALRASAAAGAEAAAAAAKTAAAGGGAAAAASAEGDAGALAAGLSWTVASPEHAADLAARAAAATSVKAEAGKSGVRGAREPYATLLLDRAATAREVRRAYRALSARLHPDKNKGSEAAAAAAFADVATAYELLSDPAARELFDAAGDGGRASFNDEQSFAASGQTFGVDLYARVPLVTELSEAGYAAAVAPGRIWLLVFYAPWCGHCQQAVPMISAVAEALADAAQGVDVGAVNCAKHAGVCGRADIREYPSYRLASGDAGGLTQVLAYADAAHADAIKSWALEVASEWRWLLAAGDLKALSGVAAWDAFLADASPALALVLIVDNAESGPARTARTNLLRLAASVGADKVVARVVDCDAEDGAGSALCDRLKVPAPPFAPVLRVLKAGAKEPTDIGETLFSPAEVEPQVALAIAETVLRLALGPGNTTDAADAARAKYERETAPKKDDEDKGKGKGKGGGGGGGGGGAPSAPKRPALKWSGPKKPPMTPIGGGGGSAPAAPRIG
jgi:thiol-disulfide isomerase/thioredoxin